MTTEVRKQNTFFKITRVLIMLICELFCESVGGGGLSSWNASPSLPQPSSLVASVTVSLRTLRYPDWYLLWFFSVIPGDRGSTVVKVLCYKSEGLWFDPKWCHWYFSLTQSFRSHYGPVVDSASNRNEYQEHFLGVKSGRCVRLTTLSPSCAVVM